MASDEDNRLENSSTSIDRLLGFLDDALDDVEPPSGASGGVNVLPSDSSVRERGCVRGCGRQADVGGDFCSACRAWVLGDSEVDPLRSPPSRRDTVELRKRHEVIHPSVFERLLRRRGDVD